MSPLSAALIREFAAKGKDARFEQQERGCLSPGRWRSERQIHGFAPSRRADFNGGGTLQIQNIFDFLNGWFAVRP